VANALNLIYGLEASRCREAALHRLPVFFFWGFRNSPNPRQSPWVKFDVSVFVKTLDGIDLSNHALKQIFGAQFVLYAGCKM
jgi:hypothetical protein